MAQTASDADSDVPSYLLSRNLSTQAPPKGDTPPRFDPNAILQGARERAAKFETKTDELLTEGKAQGEREKAELDRVAAMRSRAFGPIAAPKDPKLEKLPEPPSGRYQDPMQAFSSPGVFLAALGSLATRFPMKAAFQAGAAALEGFQKGDQAAMESQRERWQEAVKVAAESNRNELERYNAAWKKTEHNMSERAAKLNEIALSKQDVIMKAAIDSGNLGQAFKLLEDRQKAQEHLDEVLIREQDRRELRDVALGRYNMAVNKYERQAGEPMSEPTAERVAETWLAGDHTIMRDLSKGINGPADLRKVNEMITRKQSEQGLSVKDIIANQAELKALTKEELTVAGRAGNISLAVQEAKDAMPVLVASSRRTPRNGYAFWNELENKYEVQSGSPEYAQFVANLNSMINIYGRAISGSAKGTVSDLTHAREMLNPNQPTAAFEGSLAGMKQELDIAYNAPKKVIDEMRAKWTGRAPGATGEAPAVAGSAAELPPQARSALKEGEPTSFANGQQWTLKDGQPVRLK